MIITRKEAKAQSLNRYFTGKPCKRGHISERMTDSGSCITCCRENERLRYKKDPERFRAKARRVQSSPNGLAYKKKYYEENKDRLKEKDARYRLTPQRQNYLREYYESHKAEKALRTRRRRSRLKISSFKHERSMINQFYRDCPEDHHVDHEIPLNHDLVCGLHCLANLQYLTIVDNLEKSNSWNQDQWNSTYAGSHLL